MSATDPKLGRFNPLRGDPIQCGPVPTLYHAESQHNSMVCRLGLAERGCEWRSRLVDIHTMCEQLEPWYLKLNPSGNVPTLVRTVDSREVAVLDTLEILQYVDKNLEGPRLTPESQESRDAMDKLVARLSALPMDDFTHGHLLRTNAGFKHIMPRVLEGSLPVLRAMADDEKVEVSVRTAADAKIEETEALLKRFEEPDKMFEEARDKIFAVLDDLDKLLVEHYSRATPYLCGETYTFADVLATCVIARSFWTGEGDEFVKARPKLLAYWERMRRRPSFEKAQIWTGLRPGRIFCVLGDMFSGAFRSVGSFLHETVVHPVQQTPAYAWYVEEAAPFFVDHFNLTSGVVVEDVTLPTVKAIDGAVVQPTVQATQSAAHFVQDTAANTAGALAGTALGEGMHTVSDEAARRAAQLADATDKALFTPTKQVVMEKVVPGMADHGRKIAEFTDPVEHFVNDKLVAPLRDNEALKSGGDALRKTYEDTHYHFHHTFLPTVMDSWVLRLV